MVYKGDSRGMISERGSEVALLQRIYVLFLLYACKYINTHGTSKTLAFLFFKKGQTQHHILKNAINYNMQSKFLHTL